MVLYMRQSSAISEFTDSGRSFIKKKKQKGTKHSSLRNARIDGELIGLYVIYCYLLCSVG